MYDEDYTFWRVREVVDRKVGYLRLDYALSHRDLVTIAVSGWSAHPTFRQVRCVFLSEDGQLLCHRSFWWYDHFEEGEQLCLLDGTLDESRPSDDGQTTESIRQTSTTQSRASEREAGAAGVENNAASDEGRNGPEEQNDELA